MEESPGKIYALTVVLTSLATVAVGLRFYSRHIKKAGLSWDDWAVLPALLLTYAMAISMIIGSANGDLGRHTASETVYDDQGQAWPFPILTNRTAVFLQVQYVGQLSQVLAFGFTKLSVLLFYRRIFQSPWLHRAVWFMVGIDFLWTVGFFFSHVLQCYPISVNWTNLGNIEGKCLDTNLMYMFMGWSDVATNVVILALPIPCIWALKMPVAKKAAVCGVFLLGALTVLAGIGKLVVMNNAFYHSDSVDFTYVLTPLVYFPLVESALGIIGACLPLFRPLFAGVTSRGFMRDLQSVDIPSSEQSKTLWNNPDDSRAVEEWNSSISTVRYYGSDSQSSVLKEKGMPSLPASSLKMLSNAPSEGPWMKGPKVYQSMV
ncbi:hypothetical protein XPA_001936 [Xanthoria parietina]